MSKKTRKKSSPRITRKASAGKSVPAKASSRGTKASAKKPAAKAAKKTAKYTCQQGTGQEACQNHCQGARQDDHPGDRREISQKSPRGRSESLSQGRIKTVKIQPFGAARANFRGRAGRGRLGPGLPPAA